jgi:DNA (cytosine-5)-methyltransferase 1
MMSNNLTLGSLFDGSGGFTLGALLSGITPLWASEIEPFPIRVTSKRLPDVQHLGNVYKISGDKIPAVDIITAGFCCQDLSVAGRRAGLAGQRSGIFYQITRIIREMRYATRNKYPKIAVLENVPGMYSSNRGRDFLEIINELINIKDETVSIPMPEKTKWTLAGEVVGDNYSLAWRTLDAQYWGVAQRRRRCYLVIDFTGLRAGEILFNETRLCGHPPQGGFTWETSAGSIADGTGRPDRVLGNPVSVLNDQGGSYMDVSEDVTGTLRANEHGHQPIVFEPGAMTRLGNHHWQGEPTGALRADMGDNRLAVVVENSTYIMNDRNFGVPVQQHVASALTATDYKGPQCVAEPKTLKIRQGSQGQGGRGPLVQHNLSATLSTHNDQTLFEPKVYGLAAYDSNSMKSSNPYSGVYEADTAKTIDVAGGHPSRHQGGMTVVEQKVYALDSLGSNSMKSENPDSGCRETDIADALTTGTSTPGGRGGNAIAAYAIEGNGARPSHKGSGIGENISFTLNTNERHAVSYGLDRAMFNQGPNALYEPQVMEEQAATLMHRGPGAVCSNYIVRRLTPKECALLQGFPHDWCENLATPEPTEEDITIWTEVWETHRKSKGTSSKPKSRNQIIKWLRQPHSDSAEYKMWGNGVALPCVLYVLRGVALCLAD